MMKLIRITRIARLLAFLIILCAWGDLCAQHVVRKHIIGRGRQIGVITSVDFFAQLPTLWVDQHECDPPGGNYDVDTLLGTVTIAGLQSLLNTWAADGQNRWYRIRIPAGSNLHGSTYTTATDGTKALIVFPIKTGQTKCLVIESTTPNTPSVMVCAHGLPGYGGTRNPGCTNDIGKMWTLTADSTPVSGNVGLYAPYGTNHIVVRDAELTIAPGAFQSASGVKVIIAADFEGNDEGLERSYIHGYNAGDAGQPTGPVTAWSSGTTYSKGQRSQFGGLSYVSSQDSNINHQPDTNPTFWDNDKIDATTGVCLAFNQSGTVTTNGNTVNWSSGDRFGMNFSDGTNSSGYPQVISGQNNHLVINGVNYTITSHDPAASDTSLIVSPSAGVQASPVAFTLQNPPTAYATGCGDDQRSIQIECDYCWAAYNYIEKIHWFANESHAVSSGGSNGPYKLDHNWIEAGSAGWFIGGNEIDLSGGPVNNVEGRGNFIGRDPAWRFLSAAAGKSPHPPFGCGPLDNVSAHDTCPFNWAIKNNVEMKSGNKLLIDGNILDSNWSDGQSGYIMLQTPRSCGGGSTCGVYDPVTGIPLTVISNIRFSNNWVRNTPQVHQISPRSLSPGNGGGVSLPLDNTDYINNVYSNVNDDAQWGGSGPDLVQWNAGGQTFVADMTRTAGIAHAVIRPEKISNYDPATPGIFKTSFDVSSVVRSGGIVTMKMSSLRHDPTIGGSVTVANVPGWNGTFTITGVSRSGSTTLCTTDIHGNAVAANAAVHPQPCIRADGTFGDAIIYTDGQGIDGTLCSSASGSSPNSCQSNIGGVVVQAIADTHAYQIAAMSIGSGVYAHDCTGGANPAPYQVGSTSFLGAVTPTISSGVDIYYPSVDLTHDPDNSGTTCQIENSAGLPQHATFTNNTILSPNFLSIGSNGQPGQHNFNRFLHNIFVVTDSHSTADVICSSFGTEGTAAFGCWDSLTFQFYDNVLQGRSSGSWSVVGGATPNSFPSSATCSNTTVAASSPSCIGFTGFMSGTLFPITSCSYDGSNPNNCPLMALPWANNFSLSSIIPVGDSPYTSQGANLTNLQNAFTSTEYVCPVGAACGVTGPFPD